MSQLEMLSKLQDDFKTQFKREKSLLSFEEYLSILQEQPKLRLRDSAHYLKDVFDHFGKSEQEKPYATLKRYHLFDQSFDQGAHALIGQEAAQQRIYETICEFIREGHINKLMLLHGPNGSAKSTLIQCIQKAMEYYSSLDQGALYSFNWIFPNKKKESSGIGFGSSKGSDNLASYAHLPANAIDARLPNEMRDHPILLIPVLQRKVFLQDLGIDIKDVPQSLLEGQLSHKSAQIFDALLKTYQGDLYEVFKHIQVERFYISRRYRRAIATVDPQLRADAQVRQVTADRSLSALPLSLQHLNLFEPSGHLVEGNRGLIEYNDLLKRPVETFKYLLSSCEQGTVRLDAMTLYLDAVLMASCNVEHLQAFKEIPDFASFKGRIELIHIPYLLDIEKEKNIYNPQIHALSKHVHVSHDVSHFLATWAVMTRLERPQPVYYPKDLKTTIESLTPLEKLNLYSYKKAPTRLNHEQRKEILNVIEALYQEPHLEDMYEGWFGASPRELKGLLLGAAHKAYLSTNDHMFITHDKGLTETLGSHKTSLDPEHSLFYLTPLQIFKGLKKLCTQESVYPFLRRKPSAGYYQPKNFIEELQAVYLNVFEDCLHKAMGLVDLSVTENYFKRYIDELMHSIRGEKKLNQLTGQFEDADENFMRMIEDRLAIKTERQKNREDLLQRIAKWSLENPNENLDYSHIFMNEIRALQDSYLDEKRAQAKVRIQEILEYIQAQNQLNLEACNRAKKTLDDLQKNEGYHPLAVIEVIQVLQQA